MGFQESLLSTKTPKNRNNVPARSGGSGDSPFSNIASITLPVSIDTLDQCLYDVLPYYYAGIRYLLLLSIM